ncbi:hypothetical protein ACWCSH_45195 [Streptosporangium sp. NPDC001682]
MRLTFFAAQYLIIAPGEVAHNLVYFCPYLPLHLNPYTDTKRPGRP